jgi:hypothetical protein
MFERSPFQHQVTIALEVSVDLSSEENNDQLNQVVRLVKSDSIYDSEKEAGFD